MTTLIDDWINGSITPAGFETENDQPANSDISEFIGRLIDTVEDFLWVRQVDLRNTDERDPSDDGDVVIYGRDYDELFKSFFEIISLWANYESEGV